MGGQHGATYLADVGTSQPGTAVQLLDVVVFDLEAQAARVDAAVNERVEHESVLFGQGEMCSFSLTVSAPR